MRTVGLLLTILSLAFVVAPATAMEDLPQAIPGPVATVTFVGQGQGPIEIIESGGERRTVMPSEIPPLMQLDPGVVQRMAAERLARTEAILSRRAVVEEERATAREAAQRDRREQRETALSARQAEEELSELNAEIMGSYGAALPQTVTARSQRSGKYAVKRPTIRQRRAGPGVEEALAARLARQQLLLGGAEGQARTLQQVHLELRRQYEAVLPPSAMKRMDRTSKHAVNRPTSPKHAQSPIPPHLLLH